MDAREEKTSSALPPLFSVLAERSHPFRSTSPITQRSCQGLSSSIFEYKLNKINYMRFGQMPPRILPAPSRTFHDPVKSGKNRKIYARRAPCTMPEPRPAKKPRFFLLYTGFLPYFAINLSVAMLSGDVGAPYTCENLSSRANSHPSGWCCRVWGRRTVLMGGSCAMWRVRTGSGPGGSSPKDSVACAAGVPGRSQMSTFHLERLFQRAGAWPLS